MHSGIMKVLLIGCLIAAAGEVTRSQPMMVTFRIDVTGLQVSSTEPFAIGIRGNAAPLSWESTYPMKKTGTGNVYEAQVVFDGAFPLQLEYKYLLGQNTWETTGNRILKITELKMILPVTQWNKGPAVKDDFTVQMELYREIAHMDSLIFAAYNAHDAERVMSFFDPDLEFYHDTGGLTDYRQNDTATRDILSRNQNIRRELVKGSLAVYPIKDYGAIETGEHRFCHEEQGMTECGTFKFLMIWQKKNDQWKITRVVSYDH